MRRLVIVLIAFSWLFSSCSSIPKRPEPHNRALITLKSHTNPLIQRFAPIFVVENPTQKANLIGTATATQTPGREPLIQINPEHATIYTDAQPFQMGSDPKASFTNLVYRVHFDEIPGGLLPYHLGKGKNVGLLAIVTLNELSKPILVTTAHTCGCYMEITPTHHMTKEAMPDGRTPGVQSVYGEILPGSLTLTQNDRPVILLRRSTHRVKDIWSESSDSPLFTQAIAAQSAPLKSLEALSVEGGGTTSFYEESGSAKGYVKGSEKYRERLLMSWWALDWRIGQDKMFSGTTSEGPRFFTSLKPWARDDSDMRDFPRFLTYWGWKVDKIR